MRHHSKSTLFILFLCGRNVERWTLMLHGGSRHQVFSLYIHPSAVVHPPHFNECETSRTTLENVLKYGKTIHLDCMSTLEMID